MRQTRQQTRRYRE